MAAPTPLDGIKVKEAASRTGFTLWQIRGMIRRDEVRHAKRGKLVVIHPEDVAALEVSTWRGRPFEARE